MAKAPAGLVECSEMPNWWEEDEFWEHYGPEEITEGLYRSGAADFPHLPTLAELWLDELRRVGLTAPEGSPGAPRKRAGAHAPELDAAKGGGHPVRLGSGKVLRIRFDGDRTEHGYGGVRVSDEPLRTDAAIIAALTALEASETDKRDLARVLDLFLAVSLVGVLPRGFMRRHVSELLKEPREYGLRHRDLKLLEGLDVRPLEYVWALLRERRAGFDQLPREEQFALMKRAFVYVNEILVNLRKLVKFLEYGTPGGLPTRTLETADKCVQAAVLRDVVGLPPPEVAERLGIPRPPSFEEKRDVPEARDLADKGRALLEEALGEEGWRERAEAMRGEMRRWQALEEDQRRAERRADDLEAFFGPGFLAALRRARSEPAAEDGHEPTGPTEEDR